MKKNKFEGRTALITGASSGIGEQLALQLAARVSRLIVTARREHRLTALQKRLASQSPACEVFVAPCDLSDTDATASWAQRVAEQFGPVDLLVNNAGFGDHGPYDYAQWEKVHRMIRVNLVAPALLIRLFTDSMVERGCGGILNIGSGAGIALMPSAAAYVGTKHFLHGFSEALRLDLSGTGVCVTEVCPGPVQSEFDEHAGIADTSVAGLPNFFKISAEQCAREALAGFEQGLPLVFPGRAYRLLMMFQALAPRWLMRRSLIRPSLEAREKLAAPRVVASSSR